MSAGYREALGPLINLWRDKYYDKCTELNISEAKLDIAVKELRNQCHTLICLNADPEMKIRRVKNDVKLTLCSTCKALAKIKGKK